jgi:hypothetical protein
MKNRSKYSPAQRRAIAILKENGIHAQEMANGQWQVTEPGNPFCSQAPRQFNSLMGICDSYVKYCENDWLYEFCAGV